MQRDEYLPDPVDVETKFNEAGGEDLAREWLAEYGIDCELPFPVKMLGAWTDYAFNVIPGSDSTELIFTIAEGKPSAIAFPIMQDGEFVDLLIIDPDDPDYFWAVCGMSNWLGADCLGGDVVRLHKSPLDWLAAGGTGVCQIHSHSRQHLKELADSRIIQCSDAETALEAWDFGFNCDPDALDRFHMDDDPRDTTAYYEKIGFSMARARAASEVAHADA